MTPLGLKYFAISSQRWDGFCEVFLKEVGHKQVSLPTQTIDTPRIGKMTAFVLIFDSLLAFEHCLLSEQTKIVSVIVLFLRS